MKDKTLFNVLDLIEEIENVDKMIQIHSNSELMSNQYKNQKLKLSNLLFKELIKNKGIKPEVIYLFKLFLEKFYSKELQNYESAEQDSYFKTIEEAIS